MKAIQLLLVAVLAGTTGSAMHTSTMSKSAMHLRTHSSIPLPVEGDFPSLAGATLWLNSQPLTPAALRGK
jgi:hypothetical protein